MWDIEVVHDKPCSATVLEAYRTAPILHLSLHQILSEIVRQWWPQQALLGQGSRLSFGEGVAMPAIPVHIDHDSHW
jgi:hypothetical protein